MIIVSSLIATFGFLLVIFILIEGASWFVEGSGILFKKCFNCKRIKWFWLIGSKEYMGWSYEYKCKKCLNKEKSDEEELKRKRNEYKQEEELIRRTLLKSEQRLMRSLMDRC